MGLIAAAIRTQYLLAYKHDLEYKIQLIAQSKMTLATSTSDLMHTGTDLDPNNPIIKQLEQRKERLNLLEKKLDLEMAAYQAKLKAVETELESSKAMFESNIKSSFSYGSK